MKKTLNVGIVGAGLIGGKRAEAIARVPGSRVVAVADADKARAEAFAKKYNLETSPSWQELVGREDVDAIVVAVPNAFASHIAIGALRAGKHVLCEKPFGITAKESRAILAAAKENHRIVKAGFNHRFHPAIEKAKKMCDDGAIGKLVFIRGRYGHGGRQGMEKEWRFNRKISGGGELLDQGVHLIDLARWFGGDFASAYGVTEAKVWKSPWEPQVEDNGFALLKNAKTTASLHASVTNWGNIFSFEIFGDQGYLIIEGLGRWYGVETLKFGKRKMKFGDVTLKTWTFPDARDESWEKEWKNFVGAIEGKVKLNGSGEDGLQANNIVEALYQSSRKHRDIPLV